MPDLLPIDRAPLRKLVSYALTCERENTDDWMRGLVECLNDACAALGEPDRCEYGSETGVIMRVAP